MRTAFTLNTALKRLFLSSTQLTSAGAIALAEFLPESASLLHLDLTVNNIDLAGVMALSKGLKANHIMRCLDLNIPPDNDEFASICRDILNTCVRNTEEAERAARGGSGSGQGEEGQQGTPISGKGLGKGVWGLIEESELAKSIRMGDGVHAKVVCFLSFSFGCASVQKTNVLIGFHVRRIYCRVQRRCWARSKARSKDTTSHLHRLIWLVFPHQTPARVRDQEAEQRQKRNRNSSTRHARRSKP